MKRPWFHLIWQGGSLRRPCDHCGVAEAAMFHSSLEPDGRSSHEGWFCPKCELMFNWDMFRGGVEVVAEHGGLVVVEDPEVGQLIERIAREKAAKRGEQG